MAAPTDVEQCLETYLNSHLAGLRASVDLIHDIAARAQDEELGELLDTLEKEVDEDRRALRDVMDRLGVGEHTAKQALASIAESFSRLKLARAGQPDEVGRLLELESLGAGIATKMRLWLALDAVAALEPRLEGIDLTDLARRAEHQLDRVEDQRLAAAIRALGA